jgi:hypothetical protein
LFAVAIVLISIEKSVVNQDPEGFRRSRLVSWLASGSSFEPLLSTLEGLKVFALSEGHRGVSSVGVLEYASGLRLVVRVFDFDRRCLAHRLNLRLVSVSDVADYVCILIDRPNKGQQVFGKRSRSFFRKMRFTNENAGKKD